MSAPPFLFDAVVFDLDGTLVATDRFWIESARTGARRAFVELGIERAMPSADEWMSLVGLPLARGFDALFADLSPAQRAVVLERCVEEEHRALRAGQAALLPGVAETLDDLVARGVRLGIASNCGRDYLRSMLDDLGLARWIEASRCLDSPGVASKGGMVAQLLDEFGTRAAVMVGDRAGDRDAAWQNGLPHVHYARGFAQAGELVEAEATIETMLELVPRLLERTRWIERALDVLGFATATPPKSLGVTGASGAGKSLFARDVVRVLAARGARGAVVSLDDFLVPSKGSLDLSSTAFVPRDRPLDHATSAFDVDRVVREVLEPHARGGDVDVESSRGRVRVAGGDVLVLQGLFLLHPRLREHLERVVVLDVDDATSLRRLAGRDSAQDPEAIVRARRLYLPMQRAFDAEIDPREHADLVLDGRNALGPRARPS